MKTRIVIILLSLLVICAPQNSLAIEYPGEPPVTSEERDSWFERLRQNIDAQEPYTIYGRILDQNGDPVVGASVRVGWSYLSTPLLQLRTGESWVTTDGTGLFSYTITNGYSPNVFEINREGYEWDRYQSPNFERITEDERRVKFTDSQNPLVFIMRKKEIPTYLYHEERFQWYSELPTETVSYNFLKRGLKTIDTDLSLLNNPDSIDLIFHVEHDLQNNKYTFKIIAPLETNGVLLDDNELYTAPAEGYSPEVTITLSHGEEVEKYLYFTSRNLEYKIGNDIEHKPLYSRMKMEFNADPETLFFYYDTWTNPYGSPNLEYEPDMPADLFIKLRDDAKRAIQSGKLPPEPNLQEMMASGQYK